MRLKQIKLAGFKSFVDTTTISFQQQMTAIVGPNGCGKSNVIDAVRWVLGESSAKNLRGDAMTDVIFNGATTRKPIGQASVELLFENTQGRLQGSMADRSEVAIKRLVTRDGNNSYFLNGSKCRRRDITDIFLGTGLGPRSYAIIEQGTISRLIESKPQELRVFIEEAAGISKYKEKRRDTENRIRHTRENLERLTDVIAELTTQIDKLHQQAEAAKRYKTLKTSERKYKAQLSAFRWQQFEQKAQQFSDKQQAQQVVIAELQSKQHQDELAIIKAKQLLDSANEDLMRLQQQKLSLSNDITRLEQTIKHHQQQTIVEQKQLNELECGEQETTKIIITQQQKLATAEQVIAEYSPQLTITEQQLAEDQQRLMQLKKDLHRCGLDWHKANEKHQQNKQKNLQLAAQITTKQSLIAQYNEQIIQLTLNDDQQSVDQSINLAKLSTKIAQQQQQLIELTQQLEDKRQARASTQQQIMQQQQNKVAMQTKLQTLNEMLAFEKQARSADSDWQMQQQQWLATHNCQYYGKIYQLITVAPQWQLAAEVVLSSLLTSELVEHLPDFSALKETARELPETIALTLNTKVFNRVATATDDEKLTLAAHISSEYSFVNNLLQHLKRTQLNKIYLADDIVKAQQLLGSLAVDESVLCLDGTWLGHNFLCKGNTTASDHCLIKQTQFIEQNQQVEYLTVEIELANEPLHNLEQQAERLINAEYTLNKQVELLSSTLQSNEQQLALNKQSQQQQRHQLVQGQKLMAQHQQQIDLLTVQLTALKQQQQINNQNKDENNKVTLLSQQKQVLEQEIQTLENNHKQLIQQAHQLSLTLTKSHTEREHIEQQLNSTLEKQRQLTQRLQQLADKNEQQSPSVENQQRQLQTWLKQMSELENELLDKQKLLTENQLVIDTAASDKSKVSTQIEKLKEQVNQYHLEAENNRLRAQSMLEQLNDMGQILTDVLANMADNVREGQWQANIIRLAKDIDLLGPINLAAIDEYNQELTRKNFLDQQYQDLTLAITTLENAIAKIDKQSRQKFKITFDKINSDLKSLFPRVFGGGSAYLALTGDDLLETGVTIMARPPGKKNNTIHLLSGGEKALTALSLVFAIFRLNPAPFCMLDEVDAPLDDANVLRFCNLVKEMSKTVQFIYISHNKIAMEMAAHLTGVTMFEAGVSRMVSVDIDQAVAMAEMS